MVQLLDVLAGSLRAFSHLTYKQAATGRDTPWHQDEAYWMSPELRTLEPRAVTVWITLDDAIEEGGCMTFIPRSRTGTVRRVFADEETSGLMLADPDPDPDPDPISTHACPMRAGDYCRTVHATGANTSGRQRRAWALEFHASPLPRTSSDSRTWLPELWERMTRRSAQGLI